MPSPRRTGAMPRPVKPQGAVVDSVRPFDPLGLGDLTYPFRRPGTRRLLELEFALTREQAYAVAVHIAKHAQIRGLVLRASILFWLCVTLAVVVFVLIAGLWLEMLYLRWILTLTTSDPAIQRVSAIAGGLLLGLGIGLWASAERWIMDRIVVREIRRCWGDQECLWCGRDMDGCLVDRERWARCPECGMRSPIGARASTI